MNKIYEKALQNEFDKLKREKDAIHDAERTEYMFPLPKKKINKKKINESIMKK